MRRRVLFPGVLSIIVLALSSLLLIHAHPKANAQSTSACCGTNPVTAPREIVFPYYSLVDGFNSTLLLVSDSPDPLNFVVAVHSLSGQTQLSNSMTIISMGSFALGWATVAQLVLSMDRRSER